MKNFIVILFIIVAVFIGYQFISQRPQPQQEEKLRVIPKNAETEQETNNEKKATPTVQYSDAGFEPSSLTFSVGDTVTFANNSEKSLWVASDPHPSHTDYPAFDQKKEVGKGKSYSFTFTEKGTWKYHNHRAPQDGGTIIVK